MRIALIADTHLSARSPECVANWNAARRAVRRLGADLWCPDGMKQHDVSALDFFNAAAGVVSPDAPAQPAVQASTA